MDDYELTQEELRELKALFAEQDHEREARERSERRAQRRRSQMRLIVSPPTSR